jgi:hypothetical protein
MPGPLSIQLIAQNTGPNVTLRRAVKNGSSVLFAFNSQSDPSPSPTFGEVAMEEINTGFQASNGQWCNFWVQRNVKGGGTQFKANAAVAVEAIGLEIPGNANVVLDPNATGNKASGTGTTINSGNITTTYPVVDLYAFVDFLAGTPTPAAEWTLESADADVATITNNEVLRVYSRRVTAIGTYNFTATIASTDWNAFIFGLAWVPTTQRGRLAAQQLGG